MSGAGFARFGAVALMLLAGQASAAEALRLELPIACDLETECYIQSYVDRDPGPEAVDYRCGSMVYNGHRGTDFRLRDLDLMDRGVAVLAAADGRVEVVRDGMRDAHMKLFGKEIAWHRGGGNMVQIDHGGGWKALYIHLRRGSVRVKPGDRVTAGQEIGLVGMSGLTEFPHLHFELAHQGRPVDPFVGPTEAAGCRAEVHPMWSPATLARLPYRRNLLIGAGFSDVPLSREALLFRLHVQNSLPRRAPGIVFNIDFAGAQDGDSYLMRIREPDGGVLVEKTDTLAKDAPARFRFIGRKLGDRPDWTPGLYRGEFVLYREESGRREVFLQHVETLRIE